MGKTPASCTASRQAPARSGGVTVCCLGADAQPQAKRAKLHQAGAVKRPWNHTSTKVPHDKARNVSTAMSSRKRVRERHHDLTGVDVVVALCVQRFLITEIKPKNGETNV